MLLYEQHCDAETSALLLSKVNIVKLEKEIPQWTTNTDVNNITRTFKFKNYHQTLLFINAATEIIHRENHHPVITFSYNSCTIQFSTHTAKGLTQFDFICAAHIEQLVTQRDFRQ